MQSSAPLNGIQLPDETSDPTGGIRKGEVGSARKMLDILHLLASADAEQSLSVISRTLRLHPTTTLRLLATGVNAGFIARDPASRRYQLGPRALALGLRAVAQNRLATLAQPAAVSLRNQIDETVHVSVLDRGDALDIATAESSHTVRVCSTVGGRLPVHCSSTGKVLLAHLPPVEMRAIVQLKGLRRYTPRTISTLDELERDLEEVRRRGVALDFAEYEDEVWCVAAPILDRTGACVAAIGISGPRWRLERRGVDRLSQLVRGAASQLSTTLGHRPREAGQPPPDQVA
ncbi:MAG: IclR family transcriptional regulator [Chloroflexi bacterium]|nr:IclR family transcriptional regulator [Chloroflexota bacterium]